MNQSALAPGRPRGRPLGSQTRVLQQEAALGRHHFAFLRAWLQGLDLKAAWQRYLAFAERSDDMRYVERRRRALLAQVLLDAQAWARRPVSEPGLGLTSEAVLAATRVLAEAAPQSPAPALPSLDEFAAQQGFDPDQFSQAELAAEYQAFYGLDQPTDDGPESEARAHDQAPLRALRVLEQGLVHQPQPTDPVERWFSPVTHPRLTAGGVRTLDDLLNLIQHRGLGWFRPIHGLGATRAAAVLAWMQPLAAAWGRPVPEGRLRAPQNAGSLPASQPRRSPDTGNPFAPDQGEADADRATVQVWLAAHAKSPATHRAYRKEAERFSLWCRLVLQKPLGRVDAADALAYRRFLADVPAAWIQPGVLPRGDPSWRPFRGPLQASSQRHALVVVQALLDALRLAGHTALEGSEPAVVRVGTGPENSPGKDPAALARQLADQPPATAPTPLGFSSLEWAFLQEQVDLDEARALRRSPMRSGLPAGAHPRRLRLVLHLLCSTGLTLGELAAASLGDLHPGQMGPDGRAAPGTLQAGQGRRQRQQPVPEAVLAMLQAHHQDASALGALPCPAPLVCTLRPPVGRWLPARPAQPGLPGAQRQAGQPDAQRRLGESGLYRLLKRFFARASVHARADTCAAAPIGLSAERLAAASTRWLRHTFGQRGLAAGMAPRALQQAMGHASRGCTRRYVKANHARGRADAEPAPEPGAGLASTQAGRPA